MQGNNTYHIHKAPNFVLIRKPNEDFEVFMGKFKRKTKTSKVLVKAVECMTFTKPSVKKREKRNRNKFFKKLNQENLK